MKSYAQWVYPVLVCTVFLAACSGVGPERPLEPPKPLPGPQLALDPDFGDGGEVTSDFGGYDYTQALVVQEDGAMIAVGGSMREGHSDTLALARYKSDGSLDESFGARGRVLISVGQGESDLNDGSFGAVALQEDGRILASGSESLGINGKSAENMILARFTSAGLPDASFGVAGFVRPDPELLSSAVALEVQTDGKIIVAGSSHINDERRMVRFTQDGQLDSTFGTGGFLDLPDTNAYTGLSLLQTDDRDVIVALGTRLVRVSSEGVLDETFGQEGDVDTGYAVRALAQQEDEAIVVGQVSEPEYGDLSAQTSDPAPTDFRLTRYTSEGELDASFGDAGVVITDINRGEEIWGLLVQSDGKIVAAGRTSAEESAVAVVHYTASGQVDASFVGAFSGAYALALDDQNRIVVGGYRLMGETYDFALARLLP